MLGLAAVLAAACSSGPAAPGGAAPPGATPGAAASAPPVPAHGGVNLRVLVLTDESPPVDAIRQELVADGMPATVLNLKAARRPAITMSFLTRSAPGGRGGNFDGVVVPSAEPAGLTGAERAALIRYEKKFGVRQVDAYTQPGPSAGTGPPVYSGPIRGSVSVTAAGARGGFGYLNSSFPFSGGPAGPAPFGYLAAPAAGVTPLLTARVPGGAGTGALAWQFTRGGREQLGIGLAAGQFEAQFRYLGHGIVAWLTRGVSLTFWRSYLTVDYDDVINADARWSITGKCTPGAGPCPKGTPKTKLIRMTPADVRYAVRWQRQHHFTMEFLYNGGPSRRFENDDGTDPLVAAFRPVADDFYWINHTYLHINLGCEQDFRVTPWRCVRSGGSIAWTPRDTIDDEIQRNLQWARAHGIPVIRHVLATGEYSGLRILPQQPVDNPNLDEAMGPNGVRWVALDASREPDMRPVGAALGIPRHPIDVGYDVETVAEEVSEYNWFHTTKKDGGSGACEKSTTTACIKPLSLKTGWTSYILPDQVRVVFLDMINNDPRPFYMHQSNLTGDRLGYPLMNRALAAYRAVYGPHAPVVNLTMPGDGSALRQQQAWRDDLRADAVTAWVQGRELHISGPRGALAPVTVPKGSRAGPAATGPHFGIRYAGEDSGHARLGSSPFRITLPAAPFRSPSS